MGCGNILTILLSSTLRISEGLRHSPSHINTMTTSPSGCFVIVRHALLRQKLDVVCITDGKDRLCIRR